MSNGIHARVSEDGLVGHGPRPDLAREIARGGVHGAPRLGVPSDYQTDLGGIVTRTPAVVLRPASEADVVHALRAARRRGVPVAIQGTAHSCRGQSLCEGVLLSNRDAAGEPRMLEGDRVEVAARSRWRHVEAGLNRVGRAVPVLPDYLDLSVGGTLSVGGYGIDSVIHGAQVDAVERLRLVSPDGTAVWCSAAEHRELFAFALAGLGQVGVIERAVLRTVPHCRFTTLFVYDHGSLAELVESCRWLADGGVPRPDGFKASASHGRFVSVYAARARSLRDAFAVRPPAPMDGRPVRRRIVPAYRQLRSAGVSFWLRRHGGRHKVWCDYLFDHDGLTAFESHLQTLLRRDAFVGCLRDAYVVAVNRLERAVALPLEASEGVSGGMAFGIGLYCMVPARRPDLLARVEAGVDDCLQACVALGGRPYLYGWHRMTEAVKAALYGEALHRLREIRRGLDPDNLFQAAAFGG